MDITITDKQKTDKIRMKESDNNTGSVQNGDFSALLQGKLTEMNINKTEEPPDIDFAYDISMEIDDAMFFVNLIQEGQFSVQNTQNGEFQNLIKTEISQNMVIQKTVGVTNQLTELIEKAQNTQKPVRISFDNDISVILKIDKNGKVSAEFIPGSLEVQNYLMNNITSLKQKFDEQNLPYTSLSYRQNGKSGRNRNNNRKEA